MAKQTATEKNNAANEAANNQNNESAANTGLVVNSSNGAITPTVQEDEPENESIVVSIEQSDAERAFMLLDLLPTFKKGIPLNARYFKFDNKGQELKGIFCGLHKIPANEKIASQARVDANGMIDTVRILTVNDNGEREMLLVGDIVAVSTLGQLKGMVPVSIIYVADEKGKTAGTYKDLKITQLH